MNIIPNSYKHIKYSPNIHLDIIDTLLPNVQHIIHNKNIKSYNLILDGGGFSGKYLLGSLLYINKLCELNAIKINCVSGTSVGSILAILFLIKRLDISFSHLPNIQNHFNKYLNLSETNNFLSSILLILNQKYPLFYQTKQLYITYFDIKINKQFTIHKFKSNKHIIKTIRKSIHVPFVYNGKLTTQNGCFDGLYPQSFIFNNYYNNYNNYKNNQILFINLFNLPWIDMFSTKNRNSPNDAIIKGIIETHSFFQRNQNNNLCHIINKYSIHYYLLYIRIFITNTIVFIIHIFYHSNRIINQLYDTNKNKKNKKNKKKIISPINKILIIIKNYITILIKHYIT